MKKNILALVTVLLISLGAFAQRNSLWIGGGLGFNTGNSKNNYSDTNTFKKTWQDLSFSIAPHVEYMLTDNISLIGGLSYGMTKSTGYDVYGTGKDFNTQNNNFGFNLGARKYWSLNDKLSIYAGLQFEMQFETIEMDAMDDVSSQTTIKLKGNSLNVFLYPGISYKLSDRIVLYAQYGTLGYSYSTYFNTNNKDTKHKSNEFGFNLNNDVLQFGFMFKI